MRPARDRQAGFDNSGHWPALSRIAPTHPQKRKPAGRPEKEERKIKKAVYQHSDTSQKRLEGRLSWKSSEQ